MKLPVNGQWKVDHRSDKGLGLYATKNITLDRRGYISLSPRTVSLFDTSDHADFDIPISVYFDGEIKKILTSDNEPFSVNINSPLSLSQDGLSNQPDGSFDGSGVNFDGNWVVAEAADIHTYDGSAWTDRSVTLSNVRHPLCVFKNRNSLLVGNGNGVKQYNTSYSETTNLSLPAGLEVTGIAYNRNLAAIVTASADEAYLFVWDGATAAANFGYPLGSNRAFFVVPYKDTFVTLTGNGELLIWTPSGLVQLDALPAFFTTALLGDSNPNNRSVAHDTSVLVDGDIILMALSLRNEARNAEPNLYMPTQPSGIWCYDPAVGLYNRHGFSFAKVMEKTAAATSIDTSTDVITVSATVPDTGTPVLYIDDSVATPPLKQRTVYYTIKLTSTTFKLATSYENALAGVAIDLTGSLSAGTRHFSFLPCSDFGQLNCGQIGGVLARTGPQTGTTTRTSLFSEYAYGVEQIRNNLLTSQPDSFGVVCPFGENRGYAITQKMFSPTVTDNWLRLFVKARGLKTSLDRVIVKYRTSEDPATPLFGTVAESTSGTWVDTHTFTTSLDLSAVKAVLDEGKQYEVEFIAGAGSGYTAHITELSVNAGVWTVTIDEDIKNIAASDRCEFVIDNWQKLKTTTDAAYMSHTDNTDYGEFPIGVASKWVQFKIELRGYGVEIEELELFNKSQKVT